MPNPNNCQTCRYKHMKESGADENQFCYMFADEPTEVCMQHTKPDLIDFVELTQRRPLTAFEKGVLGLVTGKFGLL